MLRYKLSNIKINVHRYITDKKFFNDKKNKKKQNAHLSVSGTVPKTLWVTPLRLDFLDSLRQYFLNFSKCIFSNFCV